MFVIAKKAVPGLALSLLLGGPLIANSAWATQDGGGWQKSPAIVGPGQQVANSSIGGPDSEVSGNCVTSVTNLSEGRDGHIPYPRDESLREDGQRSRPPTPTAETGEGVVGDAIVWRTGEQSAVWQQSGIASWYGGSRWQGHSTYNGERYNENALTAAHATLPMGAKVKVSLKNSDRFVIVTINDRPGTRKRIIDLSRQAAAALGILDRGVATVTLQRL